MALSDVEYGFLESRLEIELESAELEPCWDGKKV